MNLKKNKILFVSMIALHAVWMMFISYIWLNRQFSYDWEASLMSGNSIIKNTLLNLEEKPPKDSFLFVNISFDKMLIPRLDADGFESGKVAISDRSSLSKLLEIINKKPDHKFIVLDIFFEDSTAFDSTLQVQISKSKNLILPYHLDGGDTILKSYIKGWSGLADYDSDFGTFLKYKYIQNGSLKTVPLELFEKFDNGYIKKTGPFYSSQGHLALNAISPNLSIRKYDIFTDDSLGYNSVHLCELINVPENIIHELTKNKIIVIGDFLDRDIHPTLYGNTPGPLIQLNSYLALKNGEHLLKWPILCFLFLNYLIISWFLFSDNALLHNRWTERLKKGKMGIFYDFIKYAFFLILINIFSYLLFNIHLNVLIIGIYIVAVEYALIFIKSVSDRKTKIHEKV